MVQEYGLFIGGKWRKSEGKRFETYNPATGETLATFPLATKEELNESVRHAKGAFERWKKTPAPRRGELLLEAARIFRRKKEDLARTVTTEMGKVIAEGRGDVQEVIDFYEYAAGEGRRMFGETVPSELPNKMCLTTRLPVGPVGLITPWNFPMAIPAWKSGAALIAGCSFVLKPSSLTPLCAARFVEVLDEAGFPAGVVNLVTGTGSVVGDGLVAHPDIRAISFTGGVDTGKHVYESAAKKMIKVGLELGGKNPIIAMDDANLELLMDGVMFGAFGTAGQRCTAASRLIVHQKIYDDVVDELVERAEKLRVGNPIDEKTDMGPVASADQQKKVLEYIDIGKKEGDKLLTGGVDTGRHVYETAAKKMIKVGLELGGKNPIIAMDDANLDLLMDGVMFGAFGTAGQRCTAASRLIVHQKIYDQVMDDLAKRAEKLRVGNPIDEKTDMGPVASADQEKKVLEYIEIGRKEGDTLVTGGKKLTGGAYDKGFFIAPTVFAVDRRKRLALEEIFGPVLSVLKAKDFDDAVAIANSVKYGLSSSIYTNDLRWAFRGMQELEAGITYVNAPTIGAEVQLPFGGVKETGPTDTREAGATALDEFTYWKTIYVDYSGRLQRAQIDTEKLVGG